MIKTLLTAATLGIAVPASAAYEITLTGTLDAADAVFNRPTVNGTLSPDATAVRFDAYSFTVDQTGDWDFALGTQSFSPFLLFYFGFFDAAKPLEGLQAVEAGSGYAAPSFMRTLNKGNVYTVVATTQLNGESGFYDLIAFTLGNSHLTQVWKPEVTPPGPSIPTTPPVPEPASWAMMIAGFGIVGGAARVRSRPRRAVSAV
jgi:hypothetical protein